ncbi:MAG: KEOPS complex subunit Cgi121, partial [Thermoproteota archaeon]|nr:KEOPS complex subunit Cgi121 [Thermoproteota archaeon]
GFIGLVRGKVGDTAEVQFFNADLVAGWQHLYFAALNALTVFRSQMNISNSLAVETLLYASAQRQINNAIEKLGVKPETSQVAVLALSENRKSIKKVLEVVSGLMNGERDDSVLELTEGKSESVKRLFGISDVELQAKLENEKGEKQALTDLVIEHVALLSTKR